MKPIRRKIRSHFGLTAKQLAIRSHRPWYFRWIAAMVFMSIGATLTYYILHDEDIDALRLRMQHVEQENKDLHVKLIGAQQALQVELATNNNLAKELATVQDDNLKVKEDLVFYKNMLGKKTK